MSATSSSTAGTAFETGPASPLLATLFVLVLVGFQAVSALPELLGVGSQAVSVPFRLLVLGLSGVVLYGWLVQGTRFYSGTIVFVVLALWILLIGRMLLDTIVDPLPGQPDMPVFQFVALSLFACFVPSIPFLQMPSQRTLDLARRLSEFVGAVAIVTLIVLGLQGFFSGQIFRRLSTEVLNPISVGHLAVTVFVLSLAGLSDPGRLLKALRWILLVVCLFVVVASGSRGPILAAFLLALLHAFAGQLRRGITFGGILWRLGLIAAAVGASAFLVVYFEDTAEVRILERFTEAVGDASGQQRIELYAGAWRQFTESPVLGHSYVELSQMTYPHNLVLESLMATGVVGFVLLMLALVAALPAAVRALKAGPRVAWPAMLLLQFVVHLTFSGSLLLEGRFWAMLFAVLAVDAARRTVVGRRPSGLAAPGPARIAAGLAR